MSDDDASTRSLIIKLYDKLDEHSRESRDREEKRETEDRQRWERYQVERREHELVHGKIAEWQVETNGSLKQGAKTMAEQRRATADLLERAKPPTWPKIVFAVVASLGCVWASAMYMSSKADKSELEKITEQVAELKFYITKKFDQLEKGK